MCDVTLSVVTHLYFRDFLKKKFLAHDGSKGRMTYSFDTTATDTNLVKNILRTVQNIVLEALIKETFY